ncbi:class I SAM-dependent methyltransferase [Oxalobacter vibrioformis]|uniref:Class I SAM-dependent methyltransferase n=1 Tax=Oxalobacter vibrioformis TaxID=933080 RepID=A0A9E9LWR1_9BURK|nr:class I SAM-dependent methyltransferase [Oxalobacter vibrioformis]WAW10671.1 class I SAM-dependent methyltransferase [Oxalobacter vibrioformis]
MLTTASNNLVITMHDWLGSTAGMYIREWEEAHYRSLTADIFGFHAVQIGFPSISTLQESRIKNRWLSCACSSEISRCRNQADSPSQLPHPLSVSVLHRFEELPFASQSIDLVVLPHVLEFAESPHQILREVERVLIPEGKLIISGFNPASLWGIRQAMGKVTGAHFLPEYAEFISLSRIKDWLKLLDLETSRGHFGCYIPPCKTRKWQTRFAFMEKTGERWWPYFGAIYMVEAIKRVRGIRVIGPAVRKRPQQLFHNIPVNNQTIQEKGRQNSEASPHSLSKRKT